MITYIYNIWNLYNYLVAMHGIYIAYSLLFWSYSNISFLCSFLQDPNNIKLLENKK